MNNNKLGSNELIWTNCNHKKIPMLVFRVLAIGHSTESMNQSINPILIRVYPVNRGDWIYPSGNLSNSHSPSCSIHGVLFLQTNALALLLHFSTCIFHIFFGRPRFLLPLTSNSNAFLRTCPSSLLNTCPYHLTPFTFAI